MTGEGCGGGPGVECFAVGRPMDGQSVSGDAYVCHPFDTGTLVSAIDGLGHGEEAAVASHLAKEIMEQNAGEPLKDLIRRCDSAMKHTRGAVASMARFDTSEGTLTWLGVGNVEGVLFRHMPDGSIKKEGMALRGGVVGYMLPPLTQHTFELNRGDTLILATDGLAGAFVDNIHHQDELREIAGELMREFRKPADDALVIAARYVGGEAG